MHAFRALSRVLRACAICGHRGGIGAPTALTGVRDGAPVYACAEHAPTLAGPPRELIERVAQLQNLRQRAGQPDAPEGHERPTDADLRIEGAKPHP